MIELYPGEPVKDSIFRWMREADTGSIDGMRLVELIKRVQMDKLWRCQACREYGTLKSVGLCKAVCKACGKLNN